MVNFKNKRIEISYVRMVLNKVMRIFLVCEHLFLYSIIGLSLICLVHILMGEPFSIHINW